MNIIIEQNGDDQKVQIRDEENSHQKLFTKLYYLRQKYVTKNRIIKFTAFLILTCGSFGVYKYINRDTIENRLYARYYKPFSSKNSSFILNSSRLDKALSQYDNQDYTGAILLLNEMPTSMNIVAEKSLYTGLTLMGLEEYKLAQVHFESIIKNVDKNMLVIQQVKWYLALCYLRTNNQSKAKVIFKEIVAYSSYNSKEARVILKKIN